MSFPISAYRTNSHTNKQPPALLVLLIPPHQPRCKGVSDQYAWLSGMLMARIAAGPSSSVPRFLDVPKVRRSVRSTWNPPRSFRCLGVAQPSVVREMRWLYVLHGAAHANWGLSIPLWGLKKQLVRKSEKCNTFHAKLGFSWLRVAKTRTPLIKVRQRQR